MDAATSDPVLKDILEELRAINAKLPDRPSPPEGQVELREVESREPAKPPLIPERLKKR